jgi:hypothetical protein
MVSYYQQVIDLKRANDEFQPPVLGGVPRSIYIGALERPSDEEVARFLDTIFDEWHGGQEDIVVSIKPRATLNKVRADVDSWLKGIVF